jgi:glucose dehydrogenase
MSLSGTGDRDHKRKWGSVHRRFTNPVYGFLAVGWLLLAMHAGNGYGEAMKAAEHAATNQSAPLSADGIGLINVSQSDLLQKRLRDNWLSYNGNYSGQRYSSLTQITPWNVGRVQAQWVFHTGDAGGRSNPCGGSGHHVRHQR